MHDSVMKVRHVEIFARRSPEGASAWNR